MWVALIFRSVAAACMTRARHAVPVRILSRVGGEKFIGLTTKVSVVRLLKSFVFAWRQSRKPEETVVVGSLRKFLRIESCAQLWRDYRAEASGTGEKPVAHTRHRIVGGVTRGQQSPEYSHPAKNVNYRGGAVE